ncbi:hypothetical protein [Dactylosporangium sp. NPDC048998]|uniref:hypothetical protein n=1 Tax=Dactylosporangium sp. NPDC048998 TaxID=3363976 RepID=UPI003717649F
MDVRVGSGFPVGQLAKAFVTAVTNEDPHARDRAQQRVRQWSAVLEGMTSGRLTVGSRTPVDRLPAWATPEVVRGGFATGSPAAGGPLRPYEVAVAGRAGVAAERGPVFAWHVGEAGLAELWSLLGSGGYRVELPEQAALLVVAWLLRAGDRARALDLLDEIGPFASELCFAPVPDRAAERDWSVVWREPAAVAGEALRQRRENDRVEAMREALTVWNPFADELLELWLNTRDETGAVAAVFPPGWRARADELVARYERLANVHTRCGKHRRPRENLAILRTAAQDALAGGALTPRTHGLLQQAVEAMLARRGRPGSPRHAALRAVQARVAAMPGHHRLARVVVARVAVLDPDAGITDVDAVCAPVSAAEASTHGVPAGATVPDPIRHVVRRAAAGTVAELVGAGVIPSAEVLAELVPQLAATTSAAAYPDPALRTLMAATYRAFRRRRSLLLLDLQHQVRLDELPWVRVLSPYRQATADTRWEAGETLRRLAELALDGFPATLLPNPLVSELAALGREAGEDLPWVEELAADIFMGRFSAKFLRAAHLAGLLLSGRLYARYYDIDYAALPPVAAVVRRGRDAAAGNDAFDTLCRWRAFGPAGDVGGGFWVAGNGMVIEQAQILTTHNLATLAGPLDVAPPDGWQALARRTFTAIVRLAGRLDGNPRPLPMIKDIAYAWRHLICYLSLPGAGDPRATIDELRAELAGAPSSVRARLTPAVVGLAYVAAGGRFTDDCTPAGGRRLLGWTTRRHWMQDPTAVSS